MPTEDVPAVGSTGLVGASSVASEYCQKCDGSGWRVLLREWSTMKVTYQCVDCDGTGRVERIAPTIGIDKTNSTGK
jgi:DnaJ-class molecular chaperone